MVCVHPCAHCLRVFNPGRDCSYPQIKELFFAIFLSFVLCNHRALTSDTETGQWLRSSVGQRTIFYILYAFLSITLTLFCPFVSFFLDCALPKCESKLDGPGQTSGWSDWHFAFRNETVDLACWTDYLLSIQITSHYQKEFQWMAEGNLGLNKRQPSLEKCTKRVNYHPGWYRWFREYTAGILVKNM